jgi:transcriptional regulator with XRE-family HTH domain
MTWDYSKLRGRIKEICGTQDNFAERLGMGRVSLSQRLNNMLEFTQDEIYHACDILSIDMQEIDTYFFTLKV